MVVCDDYLLLGDCRMPDLKVLNFEVNATECAFWVPLRWLKQCLALLIFWTVLAPQSSHAVDSAVAPTQNWPIEVAWLPSGDYEQRIVNGMQLFPQSDLDATASAPALLKEQYLLVVLKNELQFYRYGDGSDVGWPLWKGERRGFIGFYLSSVDNPRDVYFYDAPALRLTIQFDGD